MPRTTLRWLACTGALVMAGCAGEAGNERPLTTDPPATGDATTKPAGTAAAVTTEALAGSQPSGPSPLAAEPPSVITCAVQHRPVAGSSAGEESASLSVQRTGELLEADDEVTLGEMKAGVAYTGDAPEGRVVRIDVSSIDGDLITRTLFQIGEPSLDQITFGGGHGFTGLHYVEHNGAELQYFCKAAQ